MNSKLILRPYQSAALDNQTNGIECWMWGRQTGKSFTLACWAVERLLSRPGRLVTILSNSVANGAELNQKCAQVARMYQDLFAARAGAGPRLSLPGERRPVFEQEERFDPAHFDCLLRETRITVDGHVGRIK